jgi:putative serine protease PepD
VQGDEITAVDDTPVRNPVELGARIRAHNPGDQVKITVKHSDGNEETVTVTLGSTRK